MKTPSYEDIEVGAQLPTLVLPPVTRTMLALYAGASGDHNPVHIDLDAARRAGLTDVFAQGMLGMAWLGRLLTQWVPQAQLRRFDVRFQGITHLQHVISCRGTVTAKVEEDGEKRVLVEIQTINQYGQIRIAGTAAVALS